MRASQTMRMTLLSFCFGSLSCGMEPQEAPGKTGAAVPAVETSSVFSAVTVQGAERPGHSASQDERQMQTLFLARLMRDNKEQKNVCFIDFSDAVYAKRALQYKFYTRDVQDLLSKEGKPTGPAAAVILSILMPLYQCEYVQEKKENELIQAYLLRSSQERFSELESLVRETRLFQKLDALYVPLCDAILADQATNSNERH